MIVMVIIEMLIMIMTMIVVMAPDAAGDRARRDRGENQSEQCSFCN
jgi:hypothetical protein